MSERVSGGSPRPPQGTRRSVPELAALLRKARDDRRERWLAQPLSELCRHPAISEAVGSFLGEVAEISPRATIEELLLPGTKPHGYTARFAPPDVLDHLVAALDRILDEPLRPRGGRPSASSRPPEREPASPPAGPPAIPPPAKPPAAAPEAAPESEAGTGLPADRKALWAWAEEAGVVDDLDRPVASIATSLQDLPLDFVTAVLRKRQETLGELLSRPATRPPPRYVSLASFRRARELLAAWLVDQASSLRRAIEREQTLEAAIAREQEEPLRALAQRLWDARRVLRGGHPPVRGPEVREPAFLEGPPRFRVEVREPPARTGVPAMAEIELDTEDWRTEAPRLRCDCGAVSSCVHGLVALETIVGHLLDPGSRLRGKVNVAIGKPAWRRALESLQSATRSSLAAPADAEERIAWRLAVDHAGVRLQVVVQRRQKPGRWTNGSPLAGKPATSDLPFGVEIDRLLAAAQYQLPGHPAANYPVFHALELLRGSGRLFLDGQPDVPLEVRRVPLGLRLAPDEAGRIELVPSVDGHTDLPEEARLQLRRGARHLIFVVPEQATCWLVTVAPALAEFHSTLHLLRPRFPSDSRSDLMRALLQLGAEVPLHTPADLEGDRVPADERLLLRLTPLSPGGLLAEALVRPLPGGPRFLPGEGPGRPRLAREDRWVFVDRDLLAEPERARRMLGTLPLARARSPAPWIFELPGDEEALDLVAHLRDRADVLAEWPADALSVTRPATPAGLRIAVRDHRDWFGLEGTVTADGEEVSLAAVLAAVRAGRRYVLITGGRWLAISEDLRARLGLAAEVIYPGRAGLETSPAGAMALADLLDGAAEARVCHRWRRLAGRLSEARALEPAIPAELRAELRPYQREGFRWLARLARWEMGACLADDMGLGKTVEALAVLLHRAQEGPALVVAPTSVCFNWVRECRRFAPGLEPILFHETDRARAIEALGPGQVLIASYGLVVRHAEDLGRRRFATLVLDEAQAVKNPATRRARALRDLPADWRLALTGTPLENHIGELWSLFRVLCPGLLGSWEQFRERFGIPIERDRNPRAREALARVLRPFVLRRTKQEVAPDLPPRTEVRQLVPLSAAERRLYEDARLSAVAELAGGEDEEPGERRFMVLAALTRLRQLACHPRLVDPDSPVPSSKLAATCDLLEELREEGHRALVFSQFTSHLALVRESLAARGLRLLYLDGQTPQAERARLVDAFQRREADAFLISLKAGGTGLNLTAATYVLHLDPWWNPAVEDQASDRAHRIGQELPVTVYRLVAQGTIEEAILEMHDEKRALVAGVLDGTGAAAQLSTEELVDLIRRGMAPEELEGEDEADSAEEEATLGEDPAKAG